jgi:hypothetical protein
MRSARHFESISLLAVNVPSMSKSAMGMKKAASYGGLENS